MSQRLTPPFRADHVGSLLRPPDLLKARQSFAEGQISANALGEIEDRAIRDVVALQEDLGLQGVVFIHNLGNAAQKILEMLVEMSKVKA